MAFHYTTSKQNSYVTFENYLQFLSNSLFTSHTINTLIEYLILLKKLNKQNDK